MFLLNSRAKALAAAITTGVVSFGITAAAFAATSSQASSPSASINVATGASSKQSASGVPRLPIAAVSRIVSGQEIAFPVDGYRVDPTDQNLILDAEYKEFASCMTRFGLVLGARGPAWSVPAVNHDYDRLFGLIDLQEAHDYGYHTGEELLPDTESKPSPTRDADPSESQPNFLAVAMGDPSVPDVRGMKVPDGGCIGEARGKVADDHVAQKLYERTVNYGLTQSDADGRVIEAFGKWSGCMKDAGYSYATPMEAIDDPQWATATPSPAEVKVATADVECKVATNLTGIRVAVATAWQSKYIHGHSAQFTAMQAAIAKQVSEARGIRG